MPQVFGADELDLIAKAASLWAESVALSEEEFANRTNRHEASITDAGFARDTLPAKLDKATIQSSGDIWGQHLRSDPGPKGNHYYAVIRVANRNAAPDSIEQDIRKETPRYSAEIHSVPKDTSAKGSMVPVWTGNNVDHFFQGVKRFGKDQTWPDVQKAMQRGPRG